MVTEIPGGARHSLTVRVTAAMGAPHLGPAGAVLSTPSMIGLMEQCAMQAMQQFLAPHERSVGTRVCITHDAAARIDEDVQITATLAEVSGSRSVWEVQALGPDGKVLGGGTHERVVIDARHGARRRVDAC